MTRRRGLAVATVGVVRAMSMVFACVALLACSAEEEPGPWECSRELRRLIPVGRPPPYDVLVVLDRSPSMADEVGRLAQAGHALGGALQTLEGGGWLDLRIAVVSSDLGAIGVPGCGARGDAGRFQADARCGLDGSFLHWSPSVDGGRDQNFEGDIPDTLACLFDLPASTCPVSQPLAAALRALDGSNPGNDGFRRPGVPLLFGVITDGDDCSLLQPDALTRSGWPLADEAAVDFACFAEGVVCDPDDPVRPGPHIGCIPRASHALADPVRTLATIAGEERIWFSSTDGGAEVVVDPGPRLAPACASGSTATAAPRLTALGGSHTIACSPFWGDGLLLGTSTVGPAIGNPCIPASADLEPQVPGTQVHCERRLLWLGSGWDPEVVDEQPLPWCGSGEAVADQPCLRLDDEAMDECPTEGGLAVRLDHGSAWLRPGAFVELRCQLPCRQS